jgi:uracil-DNA glycosylase family 4
MIELIKEIKACTICNAFLPNAPKPIISVGAKAKVLIIGQAPGQKVQNTGIPWNDESGKELRRWLNVSAEQFYNTDLFSIMPMGFCFPGIGKSGDKPPRKECAPAWHQKVLQELPNVQLILLIGKYAQDYYLKETAKTNLTENVRNYQSHLPKYLPLPHPSPRNRMWMKKNDWFESEIVPMLQSYVQMNITH